MRVSIMGQAAFGEAVLRRLLDDGVEIAGISAPAPRDSVRADALWAAAVAAQLPAIDTAALKDAEGLGEWQALDADLCVMAFVTEILPAEAFAAAARGTIQYHPSLLPLHRGSAAINWAIINGETETGLTIFWPDKGIDTGPVLLQKRCAIGPEDTVGSLYFERLFPMGIEAIAEAVSIVGAGDAPRIPQDHARATYEPPCSDGHAEIQWHAEARRLHALVRGCNPQPGAWTMHAAQRLRIFDCRLSSEGEPGMPGRVLHIDDDGFDLRLNGGVLRVLRVQVEGQKKQPAAEWARAVNLAVGFRFR
ncbi:MAG: methionyl-tRNA formyltransferase [Tepidiformaceae bacterium]